MPSLLLRLWPYLLGVILAAASMYGAYHHGVSVTRQEWEAERDENTRIAQQAVIQKQQEERAKEQAIQAQIQGIQRDAIETINKIRADSAANAPVAQRMREQASMLAATASAGCADPGTTTRSQAATKAAMVLSDMYQRDNKRLAELATAYDEARARGLSCESSYDAVRQIKSPH